MALDDEAIAAFARDGVACLRSVLDPGEVAEAAAAIDAVLARPGPALGPGGGGGGAPPLGGGGARPGPAARGARPPAPPGRFPRALPPRAGDPADRAAAPPLPGARPGRRPDGHPTGPLLPRS